MPLFFDSWTWASYDRNMYGVYETCVEWLFYCQLKGFDQSYETFAYSCCLPLSSFTSKYPHPFIFSMLWHHANRIIILINFCNKVLYLHHLPVTNSMDYQMMSFYGFYHSRVDTKHLCYWWKEHRWGLIRTAGICICDQMWSVRQGVW
jgi:hypothetical protein